MDRRDFMRQAGLATGALVTTVSPVANASPAFADSGGPIRWTRRGQSQLFSSVERDGEPLVATESPGLLDGRFRLWTESPDHAVRLSPSRPSGKRGPLSAELTHVLRDSGSGLGEDLLEATLKIRNRSERTQQVEVALATSVQPSRGRTDRQTYLPLNAAGLHGDKRFSALGVDDFLKDCNHLLGQDEFRCHYLEPMASYPDERKTRALLLAPVVDIQEPSQRLRVALFTSSDQPMRFRSEIAAHKTRVWQAQRVVAVPAGGTFQLRCWLLIHLGDAANAWKTFHRYAHHEEHPSIDWIRDVRVHYYDFLSSAAGENGRRGDGYEAAVPLFQKFHVGLATQHGYYPTLGDYIHPDRKTWLAMRGDKHGPAEMSVDRMRQRIQATRATGAKAAIYIHPVLFDDATPFFQKMRDSVLVDADGQPVPFPWQGPDTEGKNWRASLASPEWRSHLLQQADWILDILRPDAIVVDETFAGIGYDHHPDHSGPTSAAAIDWHRKLHSLVRSYGPDKAVFTSDCSMSPFVLWADGEVGDHAYPNSLGNPLYRQEPVRYLAALGDKPWRPCAWHFRHMWEHQMALARQVGAGVGVSNGWIEYSGLHGLPSEERTRIIRDIESLL